jgi:aspartyl-tRNA(Asn)/glutamyl-tRNA(Gln) amidotransferase subunit A
VCSSDLVGDIAVTLAVCVDRSVNNLSLIDQSGAYFLNQVDQTVKGWRIGVLRGRFFDKMQPAVAVAFENTLQLLRDLGCQLIDFETPGIETMPELVTLIIQVEGSAYHERYRKREHLYGSSFRERILPGREIKALAYLAARRQQLELQQNWLKLNSRFDVLVMPSGPAVAPPHDTGTIEISGEHFPFRDLLGRFTRPFSLLGWPALTVPNGINAEGLPTGVQIAGPPDSEARLLILGHQLEQTLGLIPKLGIEPCWQA